MANNIEVGILYPYDDKVITYELGDIWNVIINEQDLLTYYLSRIGTEPEHQARKRQGFFPVYRLSPDDEWSQL